MSTVAPYTQADFEAAFSIDLGEGIRAERITSEGGYDGLTIAHLVDNNELCATTITFRIRDNRYREALKLPPLWAVVIESPLTIDKEIDCINCPQGLKGYIRDGRWQSSN